MGGSGFCRKSFVFLGRIICFEVGFGDEKGFVGMYFFESGEVTFVELILLPFGVVVERLG